jgi:hypothetical protein
MALASMALGALTLCGSALAGTTALPKCDTMGPDGRVKATLALADKDPETVPIVAYGRKTGVRQVTLVYKVTGCRLPGKLPTPADPPPVGPAQGVKADQIPFGVIRLDGPPDIDGDQYIVHMTVSTAPKRTTDSTGDTVTPKLAAGTYSGFIHLKARWMHRTATLVTVSRSENRIGYVGGWAALSAFAGFLVFCALHAASGASLKVHRGRVFVTGVLSVGVGALVGYTTNYVNQDVWTFSDNGFALATAAFTAATSGHLLTGLLGNVYGTQETTDELKSDKKAPNPKGRSETSSVTEQTA